MLSMIKRREHLHFFVVAALLVAAPVTPASAQDVEVSLGRINNPTLAYQFVSYPQVQVGFTIARFTRDNHPLRVATHWGTWKPNAANGGVRCLTPCPPPRPLVRTHVVGVRLIQTTSTGRLQPQLVVGFGYRLSRYDERLPYFEAGLNAGVQISPAVMTVVGLSRYHPLVSSNDPNIRQVALRVGIAVGSLR